MMVSRGRGRSLSGRLLALAAAGTVLALYAGPPAPGQFNLPSGVAVDARGNLYVANAGNSRIQKLVLAGP